nr:hypothetical protein [Tanacetum cinerariifolium]
VSVLINGENFIVHVYELSNWSVKIEDYLESKDGISDNEQVESHSSYEASTKHEMKTFNVMDEHDDVTDSEKEINETKEEEIPQKHNHFDRNSTPSDDSCPPSFEFLKGQTTLKPHGSESHKTSHCSNSFAKYREKDFKGTTLLHEINHVIEVGGALGYDMNKLGTKMSKLDRFLLSEEVVDDNHNLKAIVLDRLWSDHSPILLHTLKTDYGLISFKFFHSWFHQKDIYVVVKQAFVDTPQAATGDENTKFFHYLIKQNRRRQAIQGIMVDGTWVSNPMQVKEAFLDFYKEMFQSHVPQVSSDHSSFLRLSEAKSNELERRISSDEIRKAVWDCGSDKALSPDGFTFQFLKRYWDLFKDDIKLFVYDFFATARLPPGTNSSFITLIPKKYLDYVLSQFWFREKWRSLIRECLRSAHTSILVNGIPTSEFSIKRGLCQGDPLSPFLFIRIMEGLHIAIEDATWSNLIKGVTVGNPASGLRININKSNVYGIRFSNNDIEGMAWITRCSDDSFPFTDLGLSIGSSMKRLTHWQSLVDKFEARLSRWKAKLLSIGLMHFDCKSKGVWANIIDTINHLYSKNIIPSNSLSYKVGCDSQVRFWIENWTGDSPLYHRYHRLYRLETYPNCSVSDRFSSVEWAWHWSRPITSGICLDMIHSLKAELHSLSLFTDRDALRWGLTHDGSFTVGATRKHIDDVTLPTLSVETSSCNILPRK